MDEAFELQLKKNIEALVANERFSEAFEECVQILRKSPGNTLFTELKKDIEDRMFEINKEKIKDGIREAEKFYKSKDTVNALKKTRDMLLLAPNDSTLIKMYAKYQDKYREELQAVEQTFVQKKSEEFKKLLDAQSYSILIQEIDSLVSEHSANKPIMGLVDRTRDTLIAQEIKEKKELLSSTKFDEIFDFITTLKNIKNNSMVVLKLEAEMKRRKAGSTMRTIGDFVYAGENDLETLIKLGKYNEAVQVATELLQVNPGNVKVKKFFAKAKKKAFIFNRDEAIEAVKKTLPALEAEYKANKSAFVTL